MNESKVVKNFVVKIVLELKKRDILTDILGSSDISPLEWTFIKGSFKPFEEETE